jgi:polyribonucleotide nucleotidyltransferase
MIDPEKIGKLIGPGGKTIRGLQEQFGVTIDVEEDGSVVIASTDGSAGEGARAAVEALCAEIKVGSVYEGKVVSTKEFGAFVEIAPGTDGMVHISELAQGYVKTVGDVVKIGDVIKVKVINVDENGRIKLSRKALLPQAEGAGVETAGAAAGGGDGGGHHHGGGGGHRGGGDRGGRGGRDRDRDRGDRGGRDGDRRH